MFFFHFILFVLVEKNLKKKKRKQKREPFICLVSAKMSEDENTIITPVSTVSPAQNAWADNRPVTKNPDYDVNQMDTFQNLFKGNKFLTIQEALQAVNT